MSRRLPLTFTFTARNRTAKYYHRPAGEQQNTDDVDVDDDDDGDDDDDDDDDDDANLLCARGQLSLLPSAGREMSSSYGYGVKA